MSLERPVVAIILAGGEGRRMRGTKQLTPIGNKPALQWIVDSVHRVQLPLSPIVVLGYGAEEIREAIDFRSAVVVANCGWEEGMGSSFRKGVARAEDRSSGYLFLLGDMPLVSPGLIESVLSAVEDGEKTIIVPTYRGEKGFPVYFGPEWRGRLLAVRGDRGGREIIRSHPDSVRFLEVDDPGAILDFNRPAELEIIRNFVGER